MLLQLEEELVAHTSGENSIHAVLVIGEAHGGRHAAARETNFLVDVYLGWSAGGSSFYFAIRPTFPFNIDHGVPYLVQKALSLVFARRSRALAQESSPLEHRMHRKNRRSLEHRVLWYSVHPQLLHTEQVRRQQHPVQSEVHDLYRVLTSRRGVH